MSGVPVFTGRHLERAVSPERAVKAVRDAFIAHARDEWTMPPKVYITNYPTGDFRAMPALGGGFAMLKWINSFPGNPAQGLPTVSGLVLLSDAETGQLRAVFDAASVTALRTGAAAVLAAETLGRSGARGVAVIGAGVNGQAAARTFLARGRAVSLWDVDAARARQAANKLGATVAASLAEALAADIVVTVTPGHDVLLGAGSLSAGQHVSLMGADGPGKAEAAGAELARCRLFCDDWEQDGPNGIVTMKARGRFYADNWEQASHGGEFAHAVEAGILTRDDVTDFGKVLTGEAEGRQTNGDITLFDSTGLAIQDLAIVIAALEAVDDLRDLSTLEL